MIWRLHEAAQEELREAALWYEDEQRGLGEQFLDDIPRSSNGFSALRSGSQKSKQFAHDGSFAAASSNDFPTTLPTKSSAMKSSC